MTSRAEKAVRSASRRKRSDSATLIQNARIAQQRRLLADLCHVLGEHVRGTAADTRLKQVNGLHPLTGGGPAVPGESTAPLTNVAPAPRLSPRVQQTLDRLLKGDSEKQVALHLNVSPHTVHIYVKQLYRRLGVSSRGELFARFVQRRPG